jgi:hypothetical protein
VDVEAAKFGVSASSENTVDKMLVGADKIRAGLDADVESSELSDSLLTLRAQRRPILRTIKTEI